MSKITQVRLAGFGGQGVILAGMILGEAGAADGKHVAGSGSYGAQARGSACRAEVIFSDGPIDFPHLMGADILVALSQGAYDLFRPDVTPGTGLILYDASQVDPAEDTAAEHIGIPATEYATKELKEKQAANMILLGALARITGIVSVRSLEEAVARHVDPRFRSLNLRALRSGREMGRTRRG